MTNNRNLVFDFLKAIGIICIVLAHTLPKDEQLIYQIRNFDVPLMAIASGSLFWITSGQKNYRFLDYLKKRVIRLLVPVWVFLTGFFLISYPLSLVKGDPYPFAPKEIFYSYALLIGGIGYVWIVRVFLLLAVVSPLIVSVRKKLTNHVTFFGAIAIVYFLYELLLYLRLQIPPIETNTLTGFFVQRVILNLGFDQILALLIPYGCLFALGILAIQISKKWLLLSGLVFFSIFAVLAFYYSSAAGSFVLTQAYKYPPRLYYLSYSLFATIALYLGFDRCGNLFKKVFLDRFIVFLSNSSLWLYLWHIFFLYNWKYLFTILNISRKAIPEFFVVFVLSAIAVYLQKQLVGMILEQFRDRKRLSQWIAIALLK